MSWRSVRVPGVRGVNTKPHCWNFPREFLRHIFLLRPGVRPFWVVSFVAHCTSGLAS